MMSFYDILELDCMKGTRLLAGKDNLIHPVQWIHIIYEKDISKWISKNILVCTDGMEFSNPEKDLMQILYQLHDANAAGLIVLIGLHINVISKRVIALAEELQIPLISMLDGNEARKMISEVGNACVRSQKNDIRSDILKKLLYFPQNDKTRAKYRKILFPNGEVYIPVCFEVDRDENTGNGRSAQWAQRHMFSLLRKESRVSVDKFLCYRENDFCATLIPSYETDTNILYEKMDSIRKEIFKKTGCTFSIGIGKAVSDIDQVMQGISQARAAVDSIHMCHKRDTVRMYEKMGIYRIFFSMSDDRQLKQISANILGHIPEEEESQSLLETLNCYILNGCNLTKTADELFIHRNTLKYRLNRIREILGEDPDDVNQNFRLHLAFKIRKYLEMKAQRA